MRKMIWKLMLFLLGLLLASNAFCGETGIMQGMTKAHNDVRVEIGLQKLSWSDHLAGVAREWADYLAQENGCIMKHRPQKGKYASGYGENLYLASAITWSNGNKEVQDISPGQVVLSWAREEENYSYTTNTCRADKACGHYTQIVWKETVKVGCAQAVCADKSQIWVCNYDPAGNVKGHKPY